MTINQNIDVIKDYDREMFKSSLVSLFWSVLSFKRVSSGYRLKNLADDLGVDKSTVSRWFSRNLPNWEANTVSDIANSLNLELKIEAIDRTTGRRFNENGEIFSVETSTKQNISIMGARISEIHRSAPGVNGISIVTAAA